jgi:hypothetical protein
MTNPSVSTIYEAVAEPCRNFCILGVTSLIDPKDGREKLVLSNFAAGSTGNLVFIDVESGEGESVPLPGDSGAWALLMVGDRLLVGTCPKFGYLHSLDLRTRTWAKPLRVDNELYIWNLTLGSDGMVYGGTYPGCVLVRYDPARHELVSLGRVSDNPKNMYSRRVYGGAPGYVIVTGGFDTPFLKAWHIETGECRDFGEPDAAVREATDEFVCTEKDGKLRFYDPKTFEPIEDDGTLAGKLTVNEMTVDGRHFSGVRLKDGRLAGVNGQQYFIADRSGALSLRPIPTPAPPTHIHSVVAAPDGKLWGASGFGQTIFSYDPKTGTYWNSMKVCNAGGEVYGMAFVGEELYLTAYAGGDHIVYRPADPWDQWNNVNPRTLRPVGPDLIRPLGRSVIGPDGGIWTGWSANYGVYGGGLSRIDPATKEVAVWRDPVPGQQVVSVTADDRYVYFTTNGGGNGLAMKDEPCHFAVWDCSGEIRHLHRFGRDEKVGRTLAAGGRVFVRVNDALAVFDRDELAFAFSISLGQGCTCLLRYDDTTVYAFCETDLFRIDVAAGTAERVGTLPGAATSATVAPDGSVYFNTHGTTLYRFTV